MSERIMWNASLSRGTATKLALCYSVIFTISEIIFQNYSHWFYLPSPPPPDTPPACLEEEELLLPWEESTWAGLPRPSCSIPPTDYKTTCVVSTTNIFGVWREVFILQMVLCISLGYYCGSWKGVIDDFSNAIL